MTGTAAKTTKASTTTAPGPRVREPAGKDRVATLKSAVDRTADLSQEVFKSVEAGQRSALAAVRGFIDTVDEALPAAGERPSRRETVIDAALDMADKLITTQYGFMSSVVRSADRSLHLPDPAAK